jgi:regulator of sigma E protease
MIDYIFAAVFSLGLLIFTHELGHFTAARLTGIRVLRFSLGFGPVLLRHRRGETEYALSAVPFGGYVKMAGEGEEGETRGEPWEFASKPVWARLLVVLAGPVMNLVLALVIAVVVIYATGIEFIGTTRLGRVDETSPAHAAGLQVGDEVVSVGNTAVGTWSDMAEAFLDAGPGRIPVGFSRGGATLRTEMDIPDSLVEGAYPSLGLGPLEEPVIGKVRRRSPAHEAGLRAGDRIVSVAGTPVTQWEEVAQQIHDHPGVAVALVWQRDGETMRGEVVPEKGDIAVDATTVTQGGLIQIRPYYPRRHVSIGEAISLGVGHTYWLSKQVVLFLKVLVTGAASRDMVGGPIRIGQMAGEMVMWGAAELFYFIAYLSVVLFLLNLLPVPVLDGGHVVFLAAEAVMRRPVSLRLRMILQQIGFVLLLLLMVVVAVLDVDKLRG